MVNQDKQLLREQTLQRLKSLSKVDKQSIEKKLSTFLFQSDLWQKAASIGVTCSTDIEWDTMPIIERAWREEKRVAVPKTIPAEARMDFYEITTMDQLEVGYQMILEPKVVQERWMNKTAIDLLVVPGVVFDKYGYRIGFGGGYYDRFLTDYPHTTVALVSSSQLVAELPIEKHDLHVQYLITEKGIRKVKRKSEV